MIDDHTQALAELRNLALHEEVAVAIATIE
jgi:hypothetical protein